MNNKIILNECIQEFKEKNWLDLSYDEIMEIFSSLYITRELDTSYSEIEDSIVDGGGDGGIDSFIILVNDTSVFTEEDIEEITFNESTEIIIYISQAKTENSFKENALDKLYISLEKILDLELEENLLSKRFNPMLVEKILLFRNIWKRSVRKKSKFTINFTYSCKAEDTNVNGSFRLKVDQIVALTKERVNTGNINFNLYSAKELIELYSKPQHTKLELVFNETPITIQGRNQEEDGYLGVVTLADYYKFIVDIKENKIREYLFESNIRHYQGDTADVNQKIAETLEHNSSQDFWWLNNGITIIGSDCNLMHKTLFIDDVKIVNGLQTSYTISKFDDLAVNDDHRSILVKVIRSTQKETIDNIIFATNSQNPVSPTLLRATGEIHRNIEILFGNKGYYYDRRKNYYKNQGKPASKIFNIQDTAQAIEAILNFGPARARSKPTTLIKEDTSYNKIFDKDNIQSFLNCCLIHQKVKDCIKRIESADERNRIKNFTLHCSRILASILTCKNEYDSEDIKDLNVENVDCNTIKEAFELFESILEDYINENPDKNIINIAKANGFVQCINKKLEEHDFHE
ncbi:AIPR family protein [Methanohalophilus mahii]|uniref:Abortive phage infection n=1 Tax=Methanohalophilus mahii (strain ATCC 35705 / DSM 5219 / SLP) TaxID=547558 RepID=D5E8J3_METMS|nr:AIPR family protein [Methanohalophilus mahii]ADE37481.1 Abortive phage infection [Methanohalophilus mahii DSM 5219]